ncbi:hypothetical protein [Corynebacterium tuberculostearicum]|uniref:Uncharacterized protein n=1 Tax=Corynebacterium tuberculostearicum SK141 TaxID=553206 RepID=C6R689_9CORY|nr:hypothetical protein [Corynebacterium tuberculostearicum]EET78471.1 hypothetical protein CORTU0001_2186 [Corynebacterium tuberculostearicum SK141]
MTETFDPKVIWPTFYKNETIQELGTTRRWSISTKDKMPIDVPHLITTGMVRGAAIRQGCDQVCVDLDTLVDSIPEAANHAYYLDSIVDRVIIVDIEKTCPKDVALSLLGMLPDALYSETSMSGKGYHLVMPLPENFNQWPDATARPVLKHPEGWFELLQRHWVTFTRNPIPDDIVAESREVIRVEWDTLWASLAEKAPGPTAVNGLVITEEDLLPEDYNDEDAEVENQITEAVSESMQWLEEEGRLPDRENYGGDWSRYEFGRIAIIVQKVFKDILYRIIAKKGADYVRRADHGGVHPGTVIRISTRVAREVLDHRDKHEQERDGMNFVMWRVTQNLELQDLDELIEKALVMEDATTVRSENY